MFDFVAQLFGLVGMGMNAYSLQRKTQRNIIVMQLFGAACFFVNMLMLGAYTGALLNFIAIFRAIVYSNKHRIKHQWLVCAGFTVLYLLSYAITFTVFKKPVTVPNLIVETLPAIAMFTTTISFSVKNIQTTRKLNFISSPLWLTYNCINFAIGGILCEIMMLISSAIAVVRHDRNEKRAAEAAKGEK